METPTPPPSPSFSRRSLASAISSSSNTPSTSLPPSPSSPKDVSKSVVKSKEVWDRVLTDPNQANRIRANLYMRFWDLDIVTSTLPSFFKKGKEGGTEETVQKMLVQAEPMAEAEIERKWQNIINPLKKKIVADYPNEKEKLLLALDTLLYKHGPKVRNDFLNFVNKLVDEAVHNPHIKEEWVKVAIETMLMQYANASKDKKTSAIFWWTSIPKDDKEVNDNMTLVKKNFLMQFKETNQTPLKRLIDGKDIYEVQIGNNIFIFKADKQETTIREKAGQLTGVHPPLSAKNMATYNLNVYLGFDLIVETKMGEIVPMQGKIMQGIFLSKAEGMSLKEYSNEISMTPLDPGNRPGDKKLIAYLDQSITKEERNVRIEIGRAYIGAFSLKYDEREKKWFRTDSFLKDKITGKLIDICKDPLFRRKLNQLQFLDSIAGQVDRHQGNYTIKLNSSTGQVVKLKVEKIEGFDDDLTYGEKLTNFDKVREREYRRARVYLPNLPLIVDEETFNTIMALEEEDLIQLVGPFLTEKEMQAVKTRLEAVKKHLQALDGESRIIGTTNDAWEDGQQTPGGESVTALIMDPETSYVGREKMPIDEWLFSNAIPNETPEQNFKRKRKIPE